MSDCQSCKKLQETIDEVVSINNLHLKTIDDLTKKVGQFEKEKSQYEERILRLENEIKEYQQSKNRALKQELFKDQFESKYSPLDLNQEKEVSKEAGEHSVKKFYDCQISSDSFFTILQNKSWRIDFKNWEDYKKKIEQDSVHFCVLGSENSGKSFMISKLMGSDIPQGKQIKNQGVCVLYSDDLTTPWTALETSGSNIPIKSEHRIKELEQYFDTQKGKRRGYAFSKEEKLRELYGDNLLIEHMLLEFAVNSSPVLLVMVGKLRRDDQRFINQLKKSRELACKRLIIVHNLVDSTTIEDVEAVIQEDILDTFGAQKILVDSASSQKFIYLEKDKCDTEHVVLARQDSPAGDYYNEFTIEFIRKVIGMTPFSEKFDLVESFKDHMNLNCRSYLLTNNSPGSKGPFVLDFGETEKAEAPQGLKLENGESYDPRFYRVEEYQKIRSETLDALDSVPFAVKIVAIATERGEGRRLQVEFEVPGKCDDSNIKYMTQINRNFIVIRIKGKIEDNNQRENVVSIQQNTRKFGEFQITTNPIDIEGYSIFKGEKAEIYSEISGLKTISWRLYPSSTDDDDDF